ncbi:MAG: hypothetical protein COA44_13050 [Arcobacter sp.]|nr:MAG: hypothetical protein COA44_13050 [Arcobacter sp.]
MYKPNINTIKISENDQSRSNFIRSFVQSTPSSFMSIPESINTIPKTIVQFWDDTDNLPWDVKECIDSWNYFEDKGYEQILFNEYTARQFITEKFTIEHVEAFKRCYHPAMKSDYFRLCFILSKGGLYVDVDDTYNGFNIEHLFEDNRLKLQPLCYDIETDMMIEPDIFMNPINYSSKWIFYFNNNPLMASSGNPVIEYALQRATKILLETDPNDFPEIQSTTGPGNLTASIVVNMGDSKLFKKDNNFLILSDWETYAQTIWNLSYRQDSRNWRLSNQKEFSQKIKPSDEGRS